MRIFLGCALLLFSYVQAETWIAAAYFTQLIASPVNSTAPTQSIEGGVFLPMYGLMSNGANRFTYFAQTGNTADGQKFDLFGGASQASSLGLNQSINCSPGYALVSLSCVDSNCTTMNATCAAPSDSQNSWRLNSDEVTYVSSTYDPTTTTFCPNGEVVAGIQCLLPNCASVILRCQVVEVRICDRDEQRDPNSGQCKDMFVAYIQTRNSSSSVTFPFLSLPISDPAPKIDWNNGGTFTTEQTYVFSTPGIHIIRISGTFYFATPSYAPYLLGIVQWGQLVITPDLPGVFQNCNILTSLPIQLPATQPIFNAENSTLENMFAGCSSLQAVVLDWDLTNVISTRGMFQNCALNERSSLHFYNTFNLTDTAFMFSGTTSINDAYIFFDSTTNIQTMSYMFANSSFNRDLSFLDVSGCSDLSYMFANNSVFNQPLASFSNTTQQVKTTEGMFMNALSFSYPIDFLLNNVVSMKKMFSGAISMSSDIYLRTSGLLTDTSFLLENCISYQNKNFSISNTDSVTTMESMFDSAVLFDVDITFNCPQVTTMKKMFYNCASFNSILKLTATSLVTDMSEFFSGCTNFASDVFFDTQSVENMYGMFQDAQNFNNKVNFTDTSRVSDFSYMFFGAFKFNQKLNFNTQNATTLAGMFQNALNFNQPLNFDTRNVTHMHLMFASAYVFNSQLSFSSTANVQFMSLMFNHALKFNQGINFDTRSVTTMFSMFANAQSFNQSLIFNTTSLQHLDYFLFYAKSFNQPISFYPTTNLISMISAFSGAVNFNYSIDYFDMSSVRDMSSMFRGATNYNSLVRFNLRSVSDLVSIFSGAENFNQEISWNIPNVTDLSNMFSSATSFNSRVSLYNSTSVKYVNAMFLNAKSFNSYLLMTNTSQIQSASSMFENASSFSDPLLPLSGGKSFLSSFDTRNVTDMSNMFSGATNLTKDLFLLWGKNLNSCGNCDNFCSSCGLPVFSLCNPCGGMREVKNSTRGWSVCNCAVGEYENTTTKPIQCVAPGSSTVAPGSNTVVLSYVNTTAPIMANLSGGVQVVIPPNPTFEPNGSFVITVSNSTPRTSSVVVSIVFLTSSGTAKNISGLGDPIRFSIPLEPGVADPVQVCEGRAPAKVVPECGWLDTVRNIWVTSGCVTTNLTATQVECSCTHLTDFAFIPTNFNYVPLKQFLDLQPNNISVHPGGLLTIAVVLLLFFIVLALSIRKDVQERRQFETLTTYKHAKWDREASLVHVVLWQRWWIRIRAGLQTHHTWAALLFRRSGTSFRSVDRAFVTLMMVLTLMSLSARFHDRNQSLLERIEIIFYSLLASFLPNLLLTHLFRHTGEIGFYEKWQIDRGLMKQSKLRILRYRFSGGWRYVWYAVVILCVVGMIVYILSIALMFDQNPYYYCRGKTTLSWIADFVLPYVVSVFLVEPCKILAIVISRQFMLSQQETTRVQLETTTTDE